MTSLVDCNASLHRLLEYSICFHGSQDGIVRLLVDYISQNHCSVFGTILVDCSFFEKLLVPTNIIQRIVPYGLTIESISLQSYWCVETMGQPRACLVDSGSKYYLCSGICLRRCDPAQLQAILSFRILQCYVRIRAMKYVTVLPLIVMVTVPPLLSF